MKKFGKKRTIERLTVNAYMGCNCQNACRCSCTCVALPCDCSIGASYVVGIGNNGGVSYGASITTHNAGSNWGQVISSGLNESMRRW